MVTMTLIPQSRPLARADLDAMPDDGHRYELIDGTLVVTPTPSPAHQRGLGRLYARLLAGLPPGLDVLMAPVDVVLGKDTVVQPDVLVADRVAFTERDLRGAPLLAIEVLSRSTRHIDLGLKKSRYAAAGCPAYWIVDPDGPSVTAYGLADGEYSEVAHAAGDEVFTATEPISVTFTPTELFA